MTTTLYKNTGKKSSVCINLSLTLDDLKNDKLVDVDGIQRMFGVGREKAYAIMQQAGYVNQGNRNYSSEIALHIERLKRWFVENDLKELQEQIGHALSDLDDAVFDLQRVLQSTAQNDGKEARK